MNSFLGGLVLLYLVAHPFSCHGSDSPKLQIGHCYQDNHISEFAKPVIYKILQVGQKEYLFVVYNEKYHEYHRWDSINHDPIWHMNDFQEIDCPSGPIVKIGE